MRVQCLGTTGYHPSPSRHTACYYLPEQSILLDAGTGTFRLVDCLLKEPKESLTVLLSHAHLDHVVGLTFLLDVMAVTELSEVRVIGEQAKIEAVREHLYNELLFPVKPTFKFESLEEHTAGLAIGDTKVDWFPLDHPGNSVGYHLEIQEAKKVSRLAYVTDTVSSRDAPYIERIRDVDLLLHECYFGNDQQELAITTGHSWISEVREIVRQVKASKTILIHINPLAEILQTGFELTEQDKSQLAMEIAQDGMEVVL